MKKILLIIVPILLIAGLILFFRPSKGLDKNLELAEQLMNDRPDSALQILESIKLENFSGENKALYALLMTQAQFKNRIWVESDSLIKIAYDYFISGNDSLRKAQTYLYSARIYENMDEKKEALNNFQKASISALKTDNFNLLGLIYNRWGMFLQKQCLFDDALAVLQKSLVYIKSDNDTIGQMFTLKEIGKVYTLNKEYDLALDYYKSALVLAEIIGNKVNLSKLYNNISILYKHMGKYDLAMDYINKSLSIKSDSTFIYSSLLLKGELLSLQQQFDSAQYYLNIGKGNNNLISNATYNILMSNLEAGLGNYKSALSYLNLYIVCADKIQNQDRENAIIQLQKKYDYSIIKNENIELELQKESRNVFILIVLIVSIVVIWIISYRHNKIRREKDAIIKEGHEQLQQMADALIKWEMRLKEVKLKSKEELDAFVKWVLSKNEAIKKIERLAKMETSEIIAHKEELKLTPSEIENLKEVVDICFNKFATRLSQNFPGISEENIQYSCLLRIKIPASSIAVLLGVTDGTLVKRKYRFKKDMNQIIEGFSSLENFLLNF